MTEKKICVICKEKIIEDKEKWVELRDFDCGIQKGKTFNHLECWRERFQITNSERKKKMYAQTIKTLQKITGQVGGGDYVVQ